MFKTIIRSDRMIMLGKAREIRLALQTLQLLCGSQTTVASLLSTPPRHRQHH